MFHTECRMIHAHSLIGGLWNLQVAGAKPFADGCQAVATTAGCDPAVIVEMMPFPQLIWYLHLCQHQKKKTKKKRWQPEHITETEPELQWKELCTHTNPSEVYHSRFLLLTDLIFHSFHSFTYWPVYSINKSKYLKYGISFSQFQIYVPTTTVTSGSTHCRWMMLIILQIAKAVKKKHLQLLNYMRIWIYTVGFTFYTHTNYTVQT